MCVDTIVCLIVCVCVCVCVRVCVCMCACVRFVMKLPLFFHGQIHSLVMNLNAFSLSPELLTPLPPTPEDAVTPQPSATPAPGDKVMDTSSGAGALPPPGISKRASKSRFKPVEQSSDANPQASLQRQPSQLNFSRTKSRACVVM